MLNRRVWSYMCIVGAALASRHKTACQYGRARRLVSTPGYQLNGLNFEMQSYQTEYECFEVLHEIIKNPEALRISGLCDINQRTYLRSLKDS